MKDEWEITFKITDKNTGEIVVEEIKLELPAEFLPYAWYVINREIKKVILKKEKAIYKE